MANILISSLNCFYNHTEAEKGDDNADDRQAVSQRLREEVVCLIIN